jgi:hypothetical protein
MKFHGWGFIANLKRWEEVLKVWKEKFCFLSSERFFKNEKSKSWWNLWILKVPPFQPLEQRRDVYERRKENFCPFLFFCVLDFCWKIQTRMPRVKKKKTWRINQWPNFRVISLSFLDDSTCLCYNSDGILNKFQNEI